MLWKYLVGPSQWDRMPGFPRSAGEYGHGMDLWGFCIEVDPSGRISSESSISVHVYACDQRRESRDPQSPIRSRIDSTVTSHLPGHWNLQIAIILIALTDITVRNSERTKWKNPTLRTPARHCGHEHHGHAGYTMPSHSVNPCRQEQEDGR